MKIFLLILSLCQVTACGKAWRSTPKKVSTPAANATQGPLDQWSGRSDYTDTRWQIKSQP